MTVSPQTAARFLKVALGHVGREYPHKLDHVMASDADVLPPRVLHPAFFGSFDWHSCVHGWWTILTLTRLHPDLPEAAQAVARANETLSAENLAAELAYLDRPYSGGFERPYGWGWLLYLHLEASRHDAREWAGNLEPLARALAARLAHYLDILTYPIRTGTHFNSAFALTLALEWAQRFDPALATAIRDKARDWFSKDAGCQAWEPGGDEFLSGALSEALLMSRALEPEDFAQWFAAFFPNLAGGQPATLFTPAHVSDRSDGKIAHLDGLNLSRAWAWRAIARKLDDGSPLLAEAAQVHLDAALAHVEGDYMGEHWLASFALLAMLVK